MRLVVLSVLMVACGGSVVQPEVSGLTTTDTTTTDPGPGTTKPTTNTTPTTTDTTSTTTDTTSTTTDTTSTTSDTTAPPTTWTTPPTSVTTAPPSWTTGTTGTTDTTTTTGGTTWTTGGTTGTDSGTPPTFTTPTNTGGSGTGTTPSYTGGSGTGTGPTYTGGSGTGTTPVPTDSGTLATTPTTTDSGTFPTWTTTPTGTAPSDSPYITATGFWECDSSGDILLEMETAYWTDGNGLMFWGDFANASFFTEEHSLVTTSYDPSGWWDLLTRSLEGDAAFASFTPDTNTVFSCSSHISGNEDTMSGVYTAYDTDGSFADCVAVGPDAEGLLDGDFDAGFINDPSNDNEWINCRIGL